MTSVRSPYYILAPRYIRTSAGVRVLFKLADLLNKRGCSAFVFLRPDFDPNSGSSPSDVAPFLNHKIADYHFRCGLTPIVIYPEVIEVDKFSPPMRVRYVLNYEGHLNQGMGGKGDDFILAYSDRIATEIKTDAPKSVLFIPVSDPSFFCPPPSGEHRSGGVFYAAKYKYRFGGKTFPLTDGMPEITRDRPDSQTPEQIRALFQAAEYFYCYEDTALAIEATLCGCPTVFLPNDHFKGPLGAKELAGLGFAVGTSPDQLAHAKATVAAAREHYLKTLDDLGPQVDAFIEATQKLAAGRPYTQPFAKGYLRPPGLLQRALSLSRFMRDVIEDRGVLNTLKLIVKRIRAGRFTI
jgi:hypothetical protein